MLRPRGQRPTDWGTGLRLLACSQAELFTVAAQVLITRLQGSTDTSLHLVVLSFDGYLYLVDAMTGLSRCLKCLCLCAASAVARNVITKLRRMAEGNRRVT